MNIRPHRPHRADRDLRSSMECDDDAFCPEPEEAATVAFAEPVDEEPHEIREPVTVAVLFDYYGTPLP